MSPPLPPDQRPEAEGGGFEERYWSPSNTPVVSPEGEVLYLIHRVEDVTDSVLLSRRRDAELREALRARDEAEWIQLATEALGLGTWDMNLTTGVLVCDERMQFLFGLPADTPVVPSMLISRVHLVQQIVHSHEGRVEVRSTPEEGTTFTVWLPRAAPARGAKEAAAFQG